MLFVCCLQNMSYLCRKIDYMTELTIQINNDSIIPSLKKILMSISGVVSVKAKKTPSRPRLYDPETGEELNEKTVKLITDLEAGREKTKDFDSVDSLMKDLLS